MNINIEYIKRLNTFVVQATLHLNLEKGPRYSEDCLKHTTAFKAYCPATGTGANHNIKARLVADPGTSGEANGGTFYEHG